MALITKRFSLEDEIPLIEDEIEQLENEIENIESKAARYDSRHSDEDDDFDKHDSDMFDRLKDRWQEKKQQLSVQRDKKNRFEQYVDQWDTTEFVIRELTFGETQEVKDIVSEESFDVDVQSQDIEGTPLQGLYETEFLKRACKEAPSDAPNDPNDLPEVIGNWLLDKCESVNSFGDTDVGNMSLEDAIN